MCQLIQVHQLVVLADIALPGQGTSITLKVLADTDLPGILVPFKKSLELGRL